MLHNTFIALLRGINVTGRNKIPMAELRTLCSEMDWANVRTYIQSGNVVFRSTGDAATLEQELERAIKERFGLSIPVIIRSAADWPAYVAGNPFPDASEAEPNRVFLSLSKAPPLEGAVEGLRSRAVNGERIIQVGDALWSHFPDGMGTSKLSPALVDRFVGSPVTARNWRTVMKLDEMARD